MQMQPSPSPILFLSAHAEKEVENATKKKERGGEVPLRCRLSHESLHRQVGLFQAGGEAPRAFFRELLLGTQAGAVFYLLSARLWRLFANAITIFLSIREGNRT